MFARRKQDPIIAEPIEYMDEQFPYWLSKVLNIGKPIMDTSVTTACIQFDKEARDFTFRMNPDFAAALTVEERAFLMSHEAMHVVRNDMAVHRSGKYEDMEALNIAMDAIINDTLTNNGMTAPEWAVEGVRDVGYDCEDADLDEVYEAVVARKQSQQDEGGGGGEPDEDAEQGDEGDEAGSGEGGGDADDSEADTDDADDSEGDDDEREDDGDEDDAETEQSVDEEDGDGEGDEADGETDPTESDDEGEGGDGGQSDGDDAGDDADGGDEGAEGKGDDDASAGGTKPMAGGGHDSWFEQEGMADAAEEYKEGGEQESGGHGQGTAKYAKTEAVLTAADLPRLDLEALFRLVEPELVDGFGMGHPPRADWSRPNRRTMSLHDTRLPARRDDKRKLALASKRMELVVFLDNSGSVSSHDIAMFREIAKLLPTAKADYRFVVAGATASEVSRADMFDTDRYLPNPGATASMPEARSFAERGEAGISPRSTEWVERRARIAKAAGEKQPTKGRIPMGDDCQRAAAKLIAPGFRNGSCSTEFDAMEAWIQQALESGQLRSYPKSVLVITDCGSMLTAATEEHAARWTVLTNEPNSIPKERGRLNRRHQYLPNEGGCKIPPANFHRTGDLLLEETHVRKRARV